MYECEGRPITKLQNGVILLIFKIQKSEIYVLWVILQFEN